MWLEYTRGIAWCERALATASLDLGDFVEARRRYERSLALAREQGDPTAAAMQLIQLGRVEMLRHDSEAARAYIAQAVGLLRHHDVSTGAIRIFELCAEMAASEGTVKRRMRLIGAADVARAAVGAQLTVAECAAREQWLAPARATLGDERADTEYVFGQAMTTDEALAFALTDEQDPPASRSSAARLTPREMEVLRLIADGCTNTEIAAELVLSVRTVERHIANIYAKIGARGRADATAYALRHVMTDPAMAVHSVEPKTLRSLRLRTDLQDQSHRDQGLGRRV
jgi:DNA-binding CsgD family transcriptional regulator